MDYYQQTRLSTLEGRLRRGVVSSEAASKLTLQGDNAAQCTIAYVYSGGALFRQSANNRRLCFLLLYNTVCIVQCLVYSVYFTMGIIQCVFYSVYCTVPKEQFHTQRYAQHLLLIKS